jgi:quercetin dioxygenase-like cupin family protein
MARVRFPWEAARFIFRRTYEGAMSGFLGHFELESAITHNEDEYVSGRTSSILIKTSDLRVLVVNLTAGTEIREHTAPGPITIQPIRGRIQVRAGAEVADLGVGELVAIEALVPHAVTALEESSFLLTIAWTDHPAADVDARSLHG